MIIQRKRKIYLAFRKTKTIKFVSRNTNIESEDIANNAIFFLSLRLF